MPREVNRDGGFVDKVRIKHYATKENLIRKIVALHDVKESEAKSILQYNVLTVRNLARVTGLTTNNIHAKLRGYLRGNNQAFYPLNSCDPFNDLYLKFIYRNVKCQQLIERCAGYERDMGNYVDAEEDLKTSE